MQVACTRFTTNNCAKAGRVLVVAAALPLAPRRQLGLSYRAWAAQPTEGRHQVARPRGGDHMTSRWRTARPVHSAWPNTEQSLDRRRYRPVPIGGLSILQQGPQPGL